jgi:hypothetical protein
MATYGMGAGEVTAITLDDIDWRTGTLRVQRPKTGTRIVVPLLPPVARALVRYLRHGRPRPTRSRQVFVRARAPYIALTSSSAVRHIVVTQARAAQISAPYLGSHVLRHSHATRQINEGAPVKVVADILEASAPRVDLRLRPRGPRSPARDGPPGAVVTVRSFRQLDRDIADFLTFKQTRARSPLPPRRVQAAQPPALRRGPRRRRARNDLDRVMHGWLTRAEGRKPVTVTVELGVLRQFCVFRRRSDPRALVLGRDWSTAARVFSARR